MHDVVYLQNGVEIVFEAYFFTRVQDLCFSLSMLSDFCIFLNLLLLLLLLLTPTNCKLFSHLLLLLLLLLLPLRLIIM